MAWQRMWTLALAVYAVCKAVTCLRTPIARAPLGRRAAYLFAWPGMDAAAFLFKSPKTRCHFPVFSEAVLRIASGAVLLFLVAGAIPSRYPYLAGWTGMVGIVSLLHFGVFQLLSCFWRGAGFEARPLMDRPFTSTSLSEFWGRRWNTAFRDFAHRHLFRPLTTRFGPRAGLIAGFLFSGALHDLVISVPARSGYGGPTLYFAIQGLALTFERTPFARRSGLGSGPTGRAFTAVVLIAPLPLLFHRPFVLRIVAPFLHAIGAVA